MNAKRTTPDQIEEFKRRIQVMCRQVELYDNKVPTSRSARTLVIGKNQVGLGDVTMDVTPEEMNEIFRFIIKERFQ